MNNKTTELSEHRAFLPSPVSVVLSLQPTRVAKKMQVNQDRLAVSITCAIIVLGATTSSVKITE